MGIPEYQEFMLPLLKYAGDNSEKRIRDAYDDLADVFSLSDEEINELLPSGTQQTFKNRIGWAKTYLVKAGLLESKKRGFFNITDLGKEILGKNLTRIDREFLSQFESFNDFQSKSNHEKNKESIEHISTDKTPQELIEASISELNKTLSQEVLTEIMQCSPAFFENLVVELLVKIGYGGSRKEAGKVIGKTGDGGIDGIIKEDKLGLDTIYIQAKRWENVIGRPEIQKFVGALQGNRAKKGIFITTSRFTKEAEEYVKMIDNKVVLIDGMMLTELMIEHNLGVSTINIFSIKRIDSDYFIED